MPMDHGAHRGRFESAATAALAVACALTAAGCEVEKRDIGPTPPLSAPTGAADGRAKFYASNRYEMSEGGRMFRWNGCDRCHTDPAPGYLNLGDQEWRRGGSVPEIYRVIAQGVPGMPPYDGRITPQQIWQISGYVAGLHRQKAEVRKRSSAALGGEPSGSNWNGPIG
jgi:mono/diheme cytochrome c family protein